MDLDSLMQIMDIMSAESPGANSPDHRRQRIMLTLLKLMETKKQMETYETQHVEGLHGGRALHMLMALRPHMTDERRHMTDILIKIFEIRQIMEQMEASHYGH